MTETQARAIYRTGLAATVQALMGLAAETAKLQAELDELRAQLRASTTVSPSTPSGAVPPYQKPNATAGNRRRRPGRKNGHPGAARPPPITSTAP